MTKIDRGSHQPESDAPSVHPSSEAVGSSAGASNIGEPSAMEGRDNPRAFAIGTGFVMQVVGTMLSFSACCFWSLSTHWFEPAREPVEHWTQYFAGERLAVALVTVAVVTSLVSGIGLVAVGVGLQGERPLAGRWAMAVTSLMIVVYGAVCCWLFAETDEYATGVLAALFVVASVVLFLLAGQSAAVLRAHPPPPGLTDATDEVMEEYHRRRELRRKKYDDF